MYSSHSNNDYRDNYIGDYIIKEIIGNGTFSKVKLGINKYTNEKVAIKLLEKKKITEKKDLERIFREMSIVKNLNHPNIIKTYEIFENEKYYYIIMDYCKGGELFDYIVKKGRLNEEETSFFFYQIINGLEYIHSKNIVHRDLKPENLLLTDKNKLKIIDFGLSNYFNLNKENKTKLLKTPCGSPCYAAPEMVSGNKYNGFKTDIWAIGIVLYAMIVGYLPFEDSDNDILYKKILDCDIEFPEFLNELSIDIIKKILNSNCDERYSISDIKRHQFYLNGKKIYESIFGNDEQNYNNNNRINTFNRKISAGNIINIKYNNHYTENNIYDVHNNKNVMNTINKNSSLNDGKVIKLKTELSNFHINRNNNNSKIKINSQLSVKNINKGNNKYNNQKRIFQTFKSIIDKEKRQISEEKNIKNIRLIDYEKLNHNNKIQLKINDKKPILIKIDNKNKEKFTVNNSPTITNNEVSSQLTNQNINKLFIKPKFISGLLPLITQEKIIKFPTIKKIPLKTDSNRKEIIQVKSTRLKEYKNKNKIPFSFHNIRTNNYINETLKSIK